MKIYPLSQHIDRTETQVLPLLLKIKFIIPKPRFSEVPLPKSLKCDLSDNGWYMEIPNIYFQD